VVVMLGVICRIYSALVVTKKGYRALNKALKLKI